MTPLSLKEQPPTPALEGDQLGSELTAQSGKFFSTEEALARAQFLDARAETKAIELESRLAEQQDRLAELRERLAAQEDLLVERDRLIEDRERILRRAEADRKNLQAKLDRSNAALSRLHRSLSWRLTRPIRTAEEGVASGKKWIRKRARDLRTALHPLGNDVLLIERSGLFDREHYLKQYPEVAESGIDPIVHFLTVGAKEGKNPSPYFDTVYYARQMDDARSSAKAKD